MAVLRAATGPLILGVAIWCAAGTVTVADAAAASFRVAVPAPWWVLVLATAAAAAVRPIRRQPLASLPALAATLPWWPTPVSPAALIWTGPLAWLPVASAIAMAIGGDVSRAVRRVLAAVPDTRAPIIVGVLTALACGAALWSTGHRLRGDEPHYLMITQSLLRDGDLRIENNHDARQYDAFYRDGRLVPDFTVRGADGEIYSIHAPGASALVLPAFALGGWRGAQIFLLVLSTITGVLIWRASRAATGNAASAWFGWAATVLTPTFLLHSYAVFPDAPAALVTAAAIALLVHLDDRARRVPHTATIAIVSALLAALPWLHSRLVVLACGLGALIVWSLWRRASADATLAHHRTSQRLAPLLAFAAIPAVSAALWFGFFWAVYGAPDPRLPYGGDDAARAAWIPGAILGLLFDQQFGMAFHAPVIAAIWWAFARPHGADRAGALAWRVIGAVVVYLAAVTLFRMWWAGIPSAPARFLVAVTPALALPAAIAWTRADRATRTLLSALLGVGLATSAALIAIERGAIAWNQRDAQARWLEWLAPVVNLPRAWPSFFWTGEPAFLAHLGAIVAVLWMSWAVLRRLGLMWQWTAPTWRLATGAWLLAGIATCANTGWLLNGSDGLDPTRSQVRVARALADGAHVTTIRPMAIAHVDRSALPIVIRTEEIDRWREYVRIQSFRDVPAGRYRLRVRGPGAGTQTITATVADSPEPVQIFNPGALVAAEGARLTLVGGASVLYLGSLNPEVDMTRWIFTLEPEVLWPGVPASRSARVGAVTLAWRDHAFVESGGFWVAGERETHVAIGSATPSVALTLTNGPVANTVVVAAGRDRWTFAMTANETRPVEIPAPDGVAVLAISSSAGFQPSRVSASGDDRWLGVWVEIR